MEVQAILKNFRMSPQKVREVVRQVQGMNAVQALAVLQVVPRKSARAVAKTLQSAIANAEYGVCVAGLHTKVQPEASAGPALRVIMAEGKFHGVIAATTPTG